MRAIAEIWMWFLIILCSSLFYQYLKDRDKEIAPIVIRRDPRACKYGCKPLGSEPMETGPTDPVFGR